MSGNRHYVYQAFMESVWAILPQKLAILREIVVRFTAGEKLTAEEVETRIHGAARPPERRVNSVAVLPLFGMIFPRANMMTDISGGTSAERFGAAFAQLIKDPGVGAIVLDVNSPGGEAGGILEVADQIYNARGQKPIVAVANHMMASAAYWIGSAADEIVVTPSGDVGSIGVFAAHEDRSGALEQDGLKLTLISAGKYKTTGNPYEPLTEDARAIIQQRVDEVYDAFVGAVARHRGVNPTAVRNGFGEGRVVSANEAMKLGMADRIGTLDETIDRLLGRNDVAGSAAAGLPAQAGGGEQSVISVNSGSGQAPAADQTNIHTQEARARLARVGNTICLANRLEGETNMFLRDLINKRAALVDRAQALVDAADKDGRDMTEAERKEFNELMGAGDEQGQIGALDAQIEQIQGERSKLKAAAEKKFTGGKTEKPESGDSVMKRAEFDKLDAAAQGAFVRGGGKIQD